jgi:hypothetical protein
VVPPASRPITRVGRYSGTPLRSVHGIRLPGCHRLWRLVPEDFDLRLATRAWVLQPRSHKDRGLGSTLFARRYLGHLG